MRYAGDIVIQKREIDYIKIKIVPLSHNKVRLIIAKFHYFRGRENIRQRSYDKAHTLKAANLGVGIQWPQPIREARKALYSIMQREKANGKAVKLVRDKRLVNGVEYVQQQQQQQQQRNRR